jgi:hypothetical protein
VERGYGATITDDIIKTGYGIEILYELPGFRETIYNPNFKTVEYDGFRKHPG